MERFVFSGETQSVSRATQFFVYLPTNRTRTPYIGVTNDLGRRIYEHRSGGIPRFGSKYKIHRLAYFEQFEDIREAIAREKEIKSER